MKSIPFGVVSLAALFALGASQDQKSHPRLVDTASTQCSNCHQDLLRGREVVHPITEDCTICHDVQISESGTAIRLAENEPELCLGCHEEAGTRAELKVVHAPVADSCVICHEPHASSQPRLLTSEAVELCAECHDKADLADSHSGQITATTNCLRCHLPHGSANERMLIGSRQHLPFSDGDCKSCHRAPFADRVRLRARGERLCTACHADMTSPPNEGGTLHAAVLAKRPLAGCISCHDPHMSDNESLLVKTGPELCRTCHETIVEAALAETGHFPAADDCTSCHAPHRAEIKQLLTTPLPTLCLDCHDAEDGDLVEAHLGADMGDLRCTSCHSPHGAGNPKLLAKSLHPVVEDCETCHEGSVREILEDGESSLCLYCHDDIGALAEKAPVTHGALELGACTDCHNPHASPQAHLIKARAGGACLECHDEQAAAEGEFAHGVIALIGCRACHEPHGGDNPKLLRRTGSALCLSCHGEGNVEEGRTVRLLDRFDVPAEAVRSMASLRLSADGQRDHPVAGHRVLGAPTDGELERIETSFKGELACSTCHDPHKGTSRMLLVGGATSAMGSCLQCHPK